LSPATIQDACSNSAAYVCSRAVFSPDVSSGHTVVNECSTVQALGSPCLNVESVNYNTSQAGSSNPSTLNPGGVYNHVEYSCYNSDLASSSGGTTQYAVSAIQMPTLSGALGLALERCTQLANIASATGGGS
jgi:hypothetical protein